MRFSFLPIFVAISIYSSAQEDTTVSNFLNDVIVKNHKKDSIYYTNKVDEGMYDYMLKKSLIKRKISDIRRITNDKLILTKQETVSLKQSLLIEKSKIWKEDLFKKSQRIEADSTNSFLEQNRKKDLYLFSRPIFIRQNTIALFYLVHLCCGDIYGSVDLSFYRRTMDGWQRWITIDGGAF